MSTTYFSGVRASDHTVAPPVLRVGDAGDIGVLVTAPDRDTSKVPLNGNFDIVGDFRKADALGLTGTAALTLRHIWDKFTQTAGKISVVCVEEAADPAQQALAVIGNATDRTGLYAFLDAQNEVGIAPDCIIAPGFANAAEANQADPVTGALATIGQKIRALAIADGPGTSAAAIAARENYGYDNLVIADPGLMIHDSVAGGEVEIPLSATIAGVQAHLCEPGGGAAARRAAEAELRQGKAGRYALEVEIEGNLFIQAEDTFTIEAPKDPEQEGEWSVQTVVNEIHKAGGFVTRLSLERPQ